mmetsp:Transcript_13264/g.44225  ORF Transcript_13264/g.44225 Transcript_13264/m.44225 type:complete len:380 (+) Transcript_13264:49-1188(+)
MMPAEGQRQRRSRTLYSAEFKLRVVREALARPETCRIKPTCRDHPGVEPAQLRKWIKNIESLESLAQLEARQFKIRREFMAPPVDGMGIGVGMPSCDSMGASQLAAQAPQQLHFQQPVQQLPPQALQGPQGQPHYVQPHSVAQSACSSEAAQAADALLLSSQPQLAPQHIHAQQAMCPSTSHGALQQAESNPLAGPSGLLPTRQPQSAAGLPGSTSWLLPMDAIVQAASVAIQPPSHSSPSPHCAPPAALPMPEAGAGSGGPGNNIDAWIAAINSVQARQSSDASEAQELGSHAAQALHVGEKRPRELAPHELDLMQQGLPPQGLAPQGAAQQQALHQVALPPQQAPPQQHSDAAGQQAPLASAAEALSLLTGGGWAES